MPKFKPGDKVRCIEAGSRRTGIPGEVYTVQSVQSVFGELFIYLDPPGEFGHRGCYPSSFELVEPAKTELDPAITWVKDTFVDLANRKTTSYMDGYRDALRDTLCRFGIGVKFIHAVTPRDAQPARIEFYNLPQKAE